MATVAELVSHLNQADPAQAFAAWRQLQTMTLAAGGAGNEAPRAELAAALAAEMTATNEQKNDKGKVTHSPKYTPQVRSQVARLLSDVAGESEVAAVRQLLDDFNVREMARWALDRITAPGATATLVDLAKQAVGPEFRVGVVNALGRRSGNDVRAALEQCATDADEEVRLAALEALANLPAAESDAVLESALQASSARPAAQLRLWKARLRLAEGLVRAGQAAAGKKVYEAVAAAGGESPQVAAAKRALQSMA